MGHASPGSTYMRAVTKRTCIAGSFCGYQPSSPVQIFMDALSVYLIHHRSRVFEISLPLPRPRLPQPHSNSPTPLMRAPEQRLLHPIQPPQKFLSFDPSPYSSSSSTSTAGRITLPNPAPTNPTTPQRIPRTQIRDPRRPSLECLSKDINDFVFVKELEDAAG